MNAIYATAVGTRQIGTKAVRTPDAPPLAFGWSSLKDAEAYTAKASQAKLAKSAMHLISTDQKENEFVAPFSDFA
ncbi:MAG: hypothetical protein ACKO15_01800, partial [Burkholderiales bacterium]